MKLLISNNDNSIFVCRKKLENSPKIINGFKIWKKQMSLTEFLKFLNSSFKQMELSFENHSNK